MSDLHTLFGGGAKPDPQPEKKPEPTPTVSDELSTLATKAAGVADRARNARARFDAKWRELLATIEEQTRVLKAEADAADTELGSYADTLKRLMKEKKVTEVLLEGRPPIKLKTIKGRKEDVTLKLLKKLLGEPQADSLWKQVPNKPDKEEVEFPPARDEPPG